MCAQLMLQVSNLLRHHACGLHFWSDSQVVLKWILNPDLHLPRFVKRWVDRIYLISKQIEPRPVHVFADI